MAKQKDEDQVLEVWDSNLSNMGFDLKKTDGRTYTVVVRRRRTNRATGQVDIEQNERVVSAEDWPAFTRSYTKRTS